MYTGPKLTNDGLVFGYDTGYGIADNETSTRFYPGEPTVNEFYGSGSSGTILNYSTGYGGLGSVQTGVLDAFGTTDNIVYRKTGKLRFGPTGGQDVGTLTNGNTYTFSIYLRHYGATLMSGGEFDIVDQASGGYNFTGTLSSNMTYEWKRFSVTSTHTNSSNYHFVDVGVYQGTGVFEWCMPQIDVGSHATPFTKTSRSNTASLIDLTKSTDLNLSAMTYDSTGQPDYDGTDDYINLGNYTPIRLGTNFTIECVVRPEQDKWMYFFHKGYGSNNSLAWGRHSSADNWFFSTMIGGSYQNSYMGTATLNKYCHLVATYDGANLRLYENGVLKVTSAKTHDMLTSSASAGIGGPDRYWNGKIPVTKIYSKVLTTGEVVSNFNTYKNRFNI